MRQGSSLLLALGAIAATFSGLGQLSAQPSGRHRLDERDLERMAEATPHAAKLFAEAEEKLERGDLLAAEPLFARVRSQAPTSGLAARRHCQVLIELGRREPAFVACKQAVIHGRTPMDERAAVGALMLGDKPPTTAELAEALLLAQSVQRLSDQPFGEAALCEIAYRIGDDGMLKHCVDGLKSLAPDHYETRRWSGAATPRASWSYWLAWGVLAMLGLLTGLHALLGRRPRRSARGAVAAAIVGLVTATYSAPVAAQEAPSPAPTTSVERYSAQEPPADRKGVHWQLSSAFPINPGDPEASVPSIEARNKDPLQFGYYLQDLASEGAYADKAHDYAKAVKYWRALAIAVPDVGIGFRKSCQAYQKMNDREKALEFCAAAINREGIMLDDYVNYGQLLLAKPKALDPVELADIEAVIQHLRDGKDGQPDAGILAEQFACEVGMRLNDVKRLERCTQRLALATKNDQKTLFYQWSLAILNKNYPEARRLLGEMKKTPMKADALRRLEEATKAGDWWRKLFRDWRYGAGLGAAVLLLACTILWRRRRPRGGGPAPTAVTPAPVA